MLVIPAALGIPANLHQRRNWHGNIGRGNLARHEGGNGEGLRTEDAGATFAKVLNSSANLARGGIAGADRRQAARTHFQGLRKARVQPPFSFRPFHEDGSSLIANAR